MGLFNKLFRGRNLESDKMVLIQQMESMATEAERIYRNIINIYSTENNEPVAVSGCGLFKIRLYAATHMVQAFIMCWPEKEDDAMELADIASGVAIMSFVDPDSNPRLDRNEAKTFTIDYMKRIIVGVTNEFKKGPSVPPNQTTAGFHDLVELYHEALRDSIGFAAYTPDVKKRFDHLVKSEIMSGLHHITEVAAKL